MKKLFLCTCWALLCIETFAQGPASKGIEVKKSAAVNSSKAQDISNDTTMETSSSGTFITEFAAKKYTDMMKPVVTSVAGLRALKNVSSVNNYHKITSNI